MKKMKKIIWIIVLVVLIGFFIVFPRVVFYQNEKKIEEAAKRYFELSPNELPTGERVKTLSLATLFQKSFLKEDLKMPHTGKRCSIEKSWVKVRRIENDYQYYVYLKCGFIQSRVDHQGPKIVLNGDSTMTIGIGEKFKDPGVKSVKDNQDGTIPVKDVTIRGEVDTDTIGTYTIEYSALDHLVNKTVVKREVQVVQKLNTTIQKKLKEKSHFVGEPDDNFIRLSNMLYRIVGIEDGNVIVVADEDVANVNFTKIDDWLDYYYDHFSEKAKKMIVERKYCNMTLTDTTLDTTQCNGYTEKRKVYIPSVIEVNLAESNGENFMKTYTISWVANSKNKKEAYVTRNVFWDENEGKSFVSYDSTYNYGIRPMMMLNGESLITGGNGSVSDPYVFGDTVPAKSGTPINERFTGEYVQVGGTLYRIVEVDKDKTTRVISYDTLGSYDESLMTTSNPNSDIILYDPKNMESAGYFINNKATEYVETSYFANHEIEVPVYKGKIIYGEEKAVKKYKVKLSAPNLYEMFSAQSQRDANCSSYWLVNSSEKKRTAGAIYIIGVPLNHELDATMSLHVRVVGYLKKDVVISSGKGTMDNPYQVK